MQHVLDKAAECRAKAHYFLERAQAYEDIGLIRIADELKHVAYQFGQMADYLNQPGLHLEARADVRPEAHS